MSNFGFNRWYAELLNEAEKQGIAKEDVEQSIEGKTPKKYWKDWYDSDYSTRETIFECFINPL